MKQFFPLLGLSLISLGTFAQQNDVHQHTGDLFGVSVFANSHSLQPEKRADIGVRTKLLAQFPTWMIATDPWTGGFKELNGKPFVVSGASLLEKATNLMKNQLSVVGIKSTEWKLEEEFTNPKGFHFLHFYQEVAGQKVAFAKMQFRFTPDGKIARIHMKGYGTPDLSLIPVITVDKALNIALSELGDAVVTNKSIEKDLAWFPIPSSKGYTLHPAYCFWVEGKVQESSSVPLNMFGFVDAITGALLYRDNETKDAIDLKVVGRIYTDGYTNPVKIVGLPYVTAKIGSATTLLANDTGFFSSSALPLPSTVTVSLEGAWSKIRSAPDANATPSFSKTISTLGQSDSFNYSTGIATSRHINAYYHVNIVHDFMKKMYGSSFTGMDYALATNVDVSGTCNAYFTGAGGSSINFFPEGGGCVSFAEIGDVVYHEYGHAIVSKMYPGGMQNGGLNEGQADVWAMAITKDSILARGRTTGAPSSYIRRYDLTPKVFPKDLTGAVHDNGEIIAGAWWDYGKNVKSVDSMASLFSSCLLTDKPDGPNGTEGDVYHEMLISALINDDNDAILSNGTPHFNEIVTAFARHGIYLLQDIDITHSELNHQPKSTPIDVNASLSVSNPSFFQALNLVYRVRGGSWNKLAMVDAGGFNFKAQIPAQPGGTIIDYYFAASDLLSNEGVFFPYNFYPNPIMTENEVTLPYQFAVGVSKVTTVDFESTLGPDWSIGVSTDNATAGKWIQIVPNASYSNSQMVQTGSDHTSGSGKCMVTGNALSSNAYLQSVKNGLTTLLTPFYDLTPYSNPIVEYYRWFSNDRGNLPKKEIWRVQMSSGSTIIYRDVENTNQSDHQWRRRLFKPFDIFSGASKMQLRFLVSETPISGSFGIINGLVEGAVDDFVIYEGIDPTSSIDEKGSQVNLAKIYPNPAINELNVIIPSTSFKKVTMALYDISGKLVSTLPTTGGATHYKIDTKSIIPGQYMLIVEMDKTIQTHKVTIVSQ
jgi:hypothetical protein